MRSPAFCSTRRAAESTLPPAENGTMTVIGRLGYGAVCAGAVALASTQAMAMAARWKRDEKTNDMGHSLDQWAEQRANTENMLPFNLI